MNNSGRTKYIPERLDVILLDFEPKKGNEVEKYRPALLLSSKAYNRLLICSPISTSIRGYLNELPIENLERPSVVDSSIVQTLSWQAWNAKFVKKVSGETFVAVQQRLLPLLGIDEFFEML